MSNTDISFTEALGVDVGEKRIGIARVNSVARLPSPVTTVAMNGKAVDEIKTIASNNNADLLVVGLPTGASGQDTNQSVFSRQFAVKLEAIGLPVVFKDETLSSKQAEHMINSGAYKNNEMGNPVSIDEVAACVILNDFLGEKIDV